MTDWTHRIRESERRTYEREHVIITPARYPISCQGVPVRVGWCWWKFWQMVKTFIPKKMLTNHDWIIGVINE